MVIGVFLGLLALFVVIGLSSTLRSKRSNSDYLVAGNSVSPWLVALSAVATNNSGYMFVGQIGFTFTHGLSSIWLMIGWILGDITAVLLVQRKLRVVTEQREVLSFGGLLSRWHGTDYRRLRQLVGLITVVFLGAYAAAQLKAGSKALHALFDWPEYLGATIGAVIVFAYCLAGGIRASIWTDAAQSFVMIAAMAVLLVTGLSASGGAAGLIDGLSAAGDDLLRLVPEGKGALAFLLWVLGWFGGGFAVIGMPHVMVRYMTLDSPKHVNRVRLYYYSWFIAFYAVTIGVGLISRALLPGSGTFDAELALPRLAQQLLPPALVGLILAGLFAATISTADSLILSCSAALTRDIPPEPTDNIWITKAGTLLVTVVALVIALVGASSVFRLVLLAVSVLASSFGPLLVIYATGRRVAQLTAMLMVVAGAATAVIWRESGLGAWIYEIVPGMLAGLLVYLAAGGSAEDRRGKIRGSGK